MRFFAGFVALVGIAVAAVSVSQQHVRVSVKNGLWEQTVVTSRQSVPTMPESVLSKLTPEQRTRVETQIQSNREPKTDTHRSCLTDHDFDSLQILGSRNQGCKETAATSTETRVDEEWECKIGDGAIAKRTIHIDILSSETARGTVHVVADVSGRRIESDSQLTMRWIGAVCGKQRN
jgi:hypothetical protein